MVDNERSHPTERDSVIRALPLLVLLTLSACSRSTPAASAAASATTGDATPVTQSAPAAQPDTQKPVPAQLPDVVARVNGETIGKADFEAAIRELEGRAGGPVPADQRDRIFRGVLDQMIGYRLLV